MHFDVWSNAVGIHNVFVVLKTGWNPLCRDAVPLVATRRLRGAPVFVALRLVPLVAAAVALAFFV